MTRQCVNCPGAEDHSTAQCPLVSEQKNELRQIITDALVSMVSGVTGLIPPTGPGAIPDFIQAPIDRAVERISASLPVGVPGAEPVLIQAVAVTRYDEEEGLRLEWLLEGGIAEMEFAGQVLFAMPEANSLCDEDGSAHVYIAPAPAPTVKAEQVPAGLGIAALIVSDVCDLDPEDDGPDCVRVNVNDLLQICERHTLATYLPAAGLAVEMLLPALRQYRHNSGGDDLIPGYDYEETNRIVSAISAQQSAPERVSVLCEALEDARRAMFAVLNQEPRMKAVAKRVLNAEIGRIDRALLASHGRGEA